ncbi:MAG TPA: response regulator [Sumerlaeia bacterium]|nr:response regulator [Sumerlaeia bacterium]
MQNEPRHRILLIDPDSRYMARLFDALSMMYEVCVLSSGTEALSNLHCYTPDLVILEMDLGDMDGLTFARKLRRRAEDRNVPFVFLTNRDDPADVRLGHMVQATRYLSKKRDLRRTVTEVSRLVVEMPVPVRPKAMTLKEVYDQQSRRAHHRHLERQKKAILAKEEEPSAEVAPEEMPLIHRLRVLIAEPDDSLSGWIQSQIRPFCDCIETSSGVEAVDKAGRYLPDVLIVNVHLPHLPGFAVSQTLRRHPAFQTAPILGLALKTDSLCQANPARFGLTRIFAIPEQIDDLFAEMRRIARDPSFLCQRYKQDFGRGVAEEEKERIRLEQVKGAEKLLRRQKDFQDFFTEISEESP